MAGVHLMFQRLARRKYLQSSKLAQSSLNRCLSIVDLTALGIGSTLGLGIYVLAGQVAKQESGPSVVLSFFVAAVASVFAGVCYAEFGSRVPRAGSAYVYSYVTVGEFVAFVIGWNLILEYVIGAASVARGYSGYLDSLLDKKMTVAFRSAMPMDLPGLSPYPDFFAFSMTFILSIILSVGVKESSKVNNVLTCLNLLIVIYVVVCGLYKADIHNWSIPKSEIPAGVDGGVGGFFPFGFSGMMAGAATCFYGFVGFDCIATTGEEARNPQRAIPIAIVVSLLCVFLAYFGVSAAVTLMVPYYYQDTDAAIPMAFERVGWPVARWIVSIGALAGLSTSLLGAMFPLPRVLYAMANDGLIFRWLSRVSPRFKTPVLATLVSGLFAAVMAMFFELTALVDMMSIGTLLAYTLVAFSVIILRYRPELKENSINADLSESMPANGSSNLAAKHDGNGKDGIEGAIDSADASNSLIRRLFNVDGHQHPTNCTSSIATWATVISVVFLISINAMVIFGWQYLDSLEAWALVAIGCFAVFAIVGLVIVGRQPTLNKELSFKVPWVPFIPALSCLVNTHLMLKLSVATWLRFAVWMAVGFFMYFLYGCKNSDEEYRRLGSEPPSPFFDASASTSTVTPSTSKAMLKDDASSSTSDERSPMMNDVDYADISDVD